MSALRIRVTVELIDHTRFRFFFFIVTCCADRVGGNDRVRFVIRIGNVGRGRAIV